MRRGVAVLAVLAVLVSSCDDGSSEETEPAGASQPPTERALFANEEHLRTPAGFADCGSTVMTSGWPTTTAFNPEISAQCIMDAALLGQPSQYSYWWRTGAGGLQGVVIRVAGPDDIRAMEYTVGADGILDGVFEPCSSLEIIHGEPPFCAA